MIAQYSFEIVQKETLGDLKKWPVLSKRFHLPMEVGEVEKIIGPLRKGWIEFRVVSLSKFDNVVEVRRTIEGYRTKHSKV